MSRTQYFPLIILAAFSTAFSLATIDGFNYVVVGVMGCASVLFVFELPSFFRLRQATLITLFAAYMILVNLDHYSSIKVSSFVYTLLFLTTFSYYLCLIYKAPMALGSYIGTIRYLIVAYCVALIVQQVASRLGLPIINLIASDADKFRFNALAPEPSHSARILTLLMYSFIVANNAQSDWRLSFKDLWKRERLTIVAFLYAMLSMGSAAAVIFLCLLAVQLLKVRDFLWLILFCLVAFIGAKSVDYVPLTRSIAFLEAFMTLDQSAMFKADGSGAIRVVTIMIYLDRLDLSDAMFWLGGGTAYDHKFFFGLLPGVAKRDTGGGSLTSVLLDYGLIGGFLFTLMFMSACASFRVWLGLALWAVMIPSTPFNTQVFWLSLMLLATNKRIASLTSARDRRVPAHNAFVNPRQRDAAGALLYDQPLGAPLSAPRS